MQKFSFAKRAFARWGKSITIRHFTKIAYDRNDQIDFSKCEYADTATTGIVFFPTKPGFPRGGGRPGMGSMLQFFPEGKYVREDFGAFIKSEEIVTGDDHVLVDGKTYRVFIRLWPAKNVGIDLLILREMVGGVS